MKFDKEFKEAISHLPSKEKDKLILRLLKKDLNLANRLYFELLDDRSVNDRRSEMEEKIIVSVKESFNHFYSPGYLMMDLRDISGEITNHVRTTKDKYGEVSLNLLMLNEALIRHDQNILSSTHGKARKLCLYIIARAFKILVLISKLNDDLLIDFRDNLELLGQLISKNDFLMKTAIQNGFNVNWLVKVDIPDRIEDIHKDIRSQGYLTRKAYLNTPSYSERKP
jgi:hypothetical protein